MSLSSLLAQRFVLLANSGIQFADFSLPPALRDHDRYFVRQTAAGPLVRVYQSGRPGRFVLPDGDHRGEEIVRPEYHARLKDSLRHYRNVWLPLPFFRSLSPGHYGQGPVNWVRGFITAGEDAATDCCTLSLAFDTTTGEDPLLQPDSSDCDNQRTFGLCWQDTEIAGFIGQRWLDNWLRAVFREETAGQTEPASSFDRNNRRDFTHQAHYLNLLELFHRVLGEEPVVIFPAQTARDPVPVDLILDTGNNRSCGVISEEHPGENNGLQYSRELKIRQLSAPSRVSEGCFSSEIAFAVSPFDQGGFSAASGRADAFCWPSMVRTGDEARQLTRPLYCGDGRQGVSNPCRALRDDRPLHNGWEYPHHQPFHGKAILSPFTCLLNDQAELLSGLPPCTRFPVTEASFPPASLMMFMLCELLSHTLSQINSPQHRRQMPDSHRFRAIRSVTLVLPGTTTAIEKAKIHRLTGQALALVHQRLTGGRASGQQNDAIDPGRVEIILRDNNYGQLLWLYQQLCLAADPRQPCAGLIRQWQRASLTGTPQELRIATLDCGADSLTVAVTRYRLAEVSGPGLRGLQTTHSYRGAYPVAGESLLTDITRWFFLPALEQHLQRSGIARPAGVLRQLFTPGVSCDGDNGWRRQFVTQFLRPLSITLLQRYRQAERSLPLMEGKATEYLPAPPDPQVINYFSARVSELSACMPVCDPTEMPLTISMAEAETFFSAENCRLSRLLSLICDNVTEHRPDIILCFGGNATLPFIRQRLERGLSLPPERVITPDRLPISEIVPFCREGKLPHGKYGSVLGALIHRLITRRKLLAGCFATHTLPEVNLLRVTGVMNDNGRIPASEVLLSLPEFPDAHATAQLEIFLQHRTVLGFRGADSETGPAIPLLTLQPETAGLSDEDITRGLWVTLHWQADDQGRFSRLPEVTRVTVAGGQVLPAATVSITLSLPEGSDCPDALCWLEDGRIAGYPPSV
ncbi:virulence factor SrfB [Tatumella terrea]|uniref:Virulence factor SrfB n=1 Tax=Tatumella terrea TaxID=419007 RepID=A0ABW1W1B5_9GAMM